MKILGVLALQMLTAFFCVSVDAQDATVEGVYTNVTFAIQAETNVVTTNVAISMKAVIKNSTGETLAKTDRDKTFISLTDGKGDAYEFSLGRADWDNMVSHRSGDAIIPYSIYKWPLYINLNENIFDKKVVPGTYVLQAACEFSVPNVTYRLISNPLVVKIVAKP